MYLWLVGCYFKSVGLNYNYRANMLVVETIPPFKTRVCPVSPKDINKGMKEFKKLITEVVINGAG